MTWTVKYLPEVKDDFSRLDHAQAATVRKAIRKVQQNPLPAQEGGYGKPLGRRNSRNLTGFQKIKLLRYGIRIVYKAIKIGNQMLVIVIAARKDDEVYDEAERRILKHNL